MEENVSYKSLINERSKDAALTMVGFIEDQLKFDTKLFSGYDAIGDVLFVNASQLREIG